jgi:hypothetical protein
VIGGWLGLRLAVAAVAIATSIYLARRRKRSRAEWRAYDEAHASDRPLRPTGAASRARLRDD